MRCFFIFFAFSILWACTTHVTNKEVLVFNHDMIHKTVSMSSVIQEWSYTMLETDSNCLVGHIEKIDTDDSLIFVESNYGSSSCLYVYHRDGRFSHQIGSIGRADDEYVSLSCWCLNKCDNIVCLIDKFRNRILKYGYDGVYLEDTKLEPLYSMICDMYWMKDSIYIFKNQIPTPAMCKSPYSRFIVTDFQIKPIGFSNNEVLTSDYIIKPNQSHIWETDSNQYMMSDLNDTIYRLSESHSFVPTFYLGFSKPGLEQCPFKNNNYQEIRKNLDNRGYDVYKQCFLLNDKLFIYLKDYYLLDLKNYSGVKLICDEIVSEQHIIFPNRWINCSNDVLIGMSKASDLLLNYEYMKKKEIVLSDRVKHLYQTLDEGDNPILFFYKFRTE